jgi:hypothetical protein
MERPMPQPRHARLIRNLLCAAALVAASLSLAADLPLRTQQPAATSPMTPPTATCREWSDGCRSCQKAADGEVSCSKVGIACVPKAMQCTVDGPSR